MLQIVLGSDRFAKYSEIVVFTFLRPSVMSSNYKECQKSGHMNLLLEKLIIKMLNEAFHYEIQQLPLAVSKLTRIGLP
jgi:hypothetical protein